MRLGLALLLLSFAAVNSHAESLPLLLKRPLILGADQSADTPLRNPARILSLAYTRAKNILGIARPGASSKEILPKVSEEIIAKHSIVMALDLFAKDSESKDAARAVANLKTLVATTARLEVPLVLAEIPKLGVSQPSRKKLNLEITRLCKAPYGCYLVPLAQLQEKAAVENGLQIGLDNLPSNKLYGRGLRVKEPMAEYISQGIAEILNQQ